uniref:NADH-ubiquinone oxidoreductase chain 5 n=1 Tax=Olidiana ritcheriina TaxID=1306428 RepID=A0A5Q0N5J6_9HEMI|nr:NADH dehydrogenase subunit 5 [Olidiana ritcheriina]QFZ99640.1 NADH dehydrogenase subunit 5 [Olidiana ritcheriina]
MMNYKVYLFWLSFLSFFFFFFFLGLYFLMNDCTVMLEYSIFGLGSVEFVYLILVDWISMFFSCLIMVISCMVVLYSLQYMGVSSYSSIRFLYLIILFILSMFLLIVSPNLISIMLGWDGLGLVSFCLVVYYNSMSSYLSGMITCLTNRLGDIGILICIGWLVSYGGWHFIFNNFIYSTSVFYLIFISSFTSSAQIPFSCWLPAAMAAPTPVSALVHSSTLVTAGVYLMIRFFNFFFYMNYFFMFISLLTVIMSSFCGLFEFDLSKVVAYSTLSQLGLMMFSLFMGLVEFSYFHLLSHAVFKSLLFLCSGIFIYYMGDVQDIRMLGCMCKLYPLTSSCFNISWLSLCGIPFLSGFYSKDFLIDYSLNSGLDIFMCMFMYFSLCLTLFYSFRLFYYSMILGSGFFVLNFISDSFDYMKLSVFLLSVFSILFGCMFNWLVGFDLVFVYFPLYIKLIILLIIVFSLWFIYEIINLKFVFSVCYLNFNSYMWFLNSFIPYFYSNLYIYGKDMSNFLFWGEYYGIYGMTYFFPYLSNFIQMIFLGGFNFILLLMVFSLMFLL